MLNSRPLMKSFLPLVLLGTLLAGCGSLPVSDASDTPSTYSDDQTGTWPDQTDQGSQTAPTASASAPASAPQPKPANASKQIASELSVAVDTRMDEPPLSEQAPVITVPAPIPPDTQNTSNILNELKSKLQAQ